MASMERDYERVGLTYGYRGHEDSQILHLGLVFDVLLTCYERNHSVWSTIFKGLEEMPP